MLSVPHFEWYAADEWIAGDNTLIVDPNKPNPRKVRGVKGFSQVHSCTDYLSVLSKSRGPSALQS